jgi:hypothetical protein
MDGVLTPLAKDLMPVLNFDALRLDERRGRVQRFALHIRTAGKRVFHIRLVRKGARFLVTLGGVEPEKALAGIRVCRDYFDRWFGITGKEVTEFETTRRRT